MPFAAAAALALAACGYAPEETGESIGWVVFGGLGIAAVFTLYLTPAMYLLLAPFSKARMAETKSLEAELEDVQALNNASTDVPG